MAASPASARPAWLRHRRLETLQAMHAHLVLAVAEDYGVHTAMQLIGSSLQLLAASSTAVSQRTFRAGLQPPQSSRAVEQDATRRRRWRHVLRSALAHEDPWASLGLQRNPVQLATRRLWDESSGGWLTDTLCVWWDRDPCSHGAMRECHRIKACKPSWRRSLNLLGKRYLDRRVPNEMMEADVQMQLRAKEYSAQYNRAGVPKPVDFVQAFMLHLPPGTDGKSVALAAEAFIEGTFIKHSSNQGWIADEVLRNTPHAFSHFTFEASDGAEIVVDIQGVHDLYTDPQIHTRDRGKHYGKGNMGMGGIALFFASHHCNAICKQLGLHTFATGPHLGPATVPSIEMGPSFDEGCAVPSAPPPGPGAAQPPAPNAGLRGDGGTDPPLTPTKYAAVHYMLAQKHATHIRGGDDVIAPHVVASAVTGMFHLQESANQGGVSAMLALACLHLHIRPRKAMLRTLVDEMEEPLPYDARAAFRYVVLAAERGVASAMSAAGSAARHGRGCTASAAKAAGWYRAALTARETSAMPEDVEIEGERLPGGDMCELELLKALTELYQEGGVDLLPNPLLARQFELLAHSCARREQEEEEAENEMDLSEQDAGMQPCLPCGEGCDGRLV